MFQDKNINDLIRTDKQYATEFWYHQEDCLKGIYIYCH